MSRLVSVGCYRLLFHGGAAAISFYFVSSFLSELFQSVSYIFDYLDEILVNIYQKHVICHVLIDIYLFSLKYI